MLLSYNTQFQGNVKQLFKLDFKRRPGRTDVHYLYGFLYYNLFNALPTPLSCFRSRAERHKQGFSVK